MIKRKADKDEIISFIGKHDGCTYIDLMRYFDCSQQHIRRKMSGTKNQIRVDKRRQPFKFYLIKKRQPPELVKPSGLLTIPWVNWHPETPIGPAEWSL